MARSSAGLLLLLAIAACAYGGQPSGATLGPTDEPTPPRPARPSSSFSLSPVQPSRADVITGRLGLDAVEAGCTHLETEDGTFYEVIYPRGWRVQRAPLQLLRPDGSVHARAGELVTVQGHVDPNIATTCQVGPVFRAEAVLDR